MNVILGGEKLGDRGERESYTAPVSLSLCCRAMACGKIKFKGENQMILPCTDCKHRKERVEGHRTFIGCSDEEKKKGFIEDDWTYHHRCTNYEKSNSKEK